MTDLKVCTNHKNVNWIFQYYMLKVCKEGCKNSPKLCMSVLSALSVKRNLVEYRSLLHGRVISTGSHPKEAGPFYAATNV